jgi:hypothetical protein
MIRLNTNPVIVQFFKKFYEKSGEAKRCGRFNIDYQKTRKTEACLRHETDSVKPDKGCSGLCCRVVLNNLYLTVFI